MALRHGRGEGVACIMRACISIQSQLAIDRGRRREGKLCGCMDFFYSRPQQRRSNASEMRAFRGALENICVFSAKTPRQIAFFQKNKTPRHSLTVCACLFGGGGMPATHVFVAVLIAVLCFHGVGGTGTGELGAQLTARAQLAAEDPGTASPQACRGTKKYGVAG